MSDFKSKLPDLKELASITSKLYTDIKKSVGEIVQTYKQNRAQQASEGEQTKPQNTAATEEKPTEEEKPSAKEKPTAKEKFSEEVKPSKEEITDEKATSKDSKNDE